MHVWIYFSSILCELAFTMAFSFETRSPDIESPYRWGWQFCLQSNGLSFKSSYLILLFLTTLTGLCLSLLYHGVIGENFVAPVLLFNLNTCVRYMTFDMGMTLDSLFSIPKHAKIFFCYKWVQCLDTSTLLTEFE